MQFGEHITIDGYGGAFEKLEDRECVLAVISDLPEILGMIKICEPELVRFEGNDKKDPGGWSGYVMIAESHISIHTFSRRGFLSADVYSCQNGLDIEKIRDYFRAKFDLKDMEVNHIKRGTRYPDENIY